MRKTGHRARREELSAGRIEYIEAARQRLRSRRMRRTMLLVALVAAAVIYLTGLVNTSGMLRAAPSSTRLTAPVTRPAP